MPFLQLLWVSPLWACCLPFRRSTLGKLELLHTEGSGKSLISHLLCYRATYTQELNSGRHKSPDSCIKKGQTLWCNLCSHAPFGIRLRWDFSRRHFLVYFNLLSMMLPSLQDRFLPGSKLNKPLACECHSQTLLLGNPHKTGAERWTIHWELEIQNYPLKVKLQKNYLSC